MVTKKTPTIIDVANKANVSLATASRVLNHPNLVHKNTLVKVQKAMKDIDYVVNTTARNLRKKSNRTLLVLVPTVSTPFFFQVLTGMEQTASKNGYSILIAHTEDDHGNNRNLINYMHQNRTDGVIVLGGDEQFNKLAKPKYVDKLLFVALNENVQDATVPTIAIDGYQAIKQLVAHLAELGHQHIGHVAGPVDTVSSATNRYKGFIDGLQEHGLQPGWQFFTLYNMESGIEAAKAWIALPHQPTAIICSCDEVAFGFNNEIYRNGYRVPRDISITGFDDIPLAQYSIPSLTTIRQPHFQLGAAAVTTILQKIANPSKTIKDIYLKGTLIIRESTTRYSSNKHAVTAPPK